MPRGKQKGPTGSQLSGSLIPGAMRMGTGHHVLHVKFLIDPEYAVDLAQYCERYNCSPVLAFQAMHMHFGREMIARLTKMMRSDMIEELQRVPSAYDRKPKRK